MGDQQTTELYSLVTFSAGTGLITTNLSLTLSFTTTSGWLNTNLFPEYTTTLNPGGPTPYTVTTSLTFYIVNPTATTSAPQASSSSSPEVVQSTALSATSSASSPSKSPTSSSSQKSPTSSSSQKSPTSSSSHGYSPGTLAGVAIACGILGALLVGSAWLVVACLFKRRRMHRNPPGGNGMLPSSARNPRKSDYELDDLPQETTHDELRTEFSRLETDIKTWVLEYFNNTPPSHDSSDNAFLNVLGAQGNDRSSTQWLHQVMRNKNATVFVRAFVARCLLSRIDINGNPNTTLLSAPLLQNYQNMLPKGASNADPPRLPKELHHWRALTVSLLAQKHPNRRVELDQDRIRAVSSAERDILAVLAPWRNMRSQDRCADKLHSIARNVAFFGQRAFEQAHQIVVFWPPSGVAIFPGLKQYRLDTQNSIIVREPVME